MTICAIHQPNFFPWAGYFDKIRRADVFIFLDDVAYPKSGSGAGSWCNRVMLLNGGVPTWCGLPIKRETGTQLIKNVEFSNKEYNAQKILKSLAYNYKKTPGYQEIMPLIESLVRYPQNNLAEYNINAIIALSNYFGFKTKFIRQSELEHHHQSTELLIELLEQVKADAYLCGNGSNGYLEENLFEKAGIELIYQNKNPAEHFVSNLNIEDSKLSILHLLMFYFNHFLI